MSFEKVSETEFVETTETTITRNINRLKAMKKAHEASIIEIDLLLSEAAKLGIKII